MDDDLIELRFQLYDDRFEHLEKRFDDLAEDHSDSQEKKESKRNQAMNWAMIALFVVEVVIGLVEIGMMHHA